MPQYQRRKEKGLTQINKDKDFIGKEGKVDGKGPEVVWGDPIVVPIN